MNNSMWIFAAVFAGISASLQSSITGGLSKKLSLAATLTLNTVVFTVIALVYWAWEISKNGFQKDQWRTLTPVEMTGGIFGFLLVLCLTLSFPRIGALYSVVLMILGQCVMALVVDQFGLFNMPVQPISVSRVAAIGFLIAGVFLLNK